MIAIASLVVTFLATVFGVVAGERKADGDGRSVFIISKASGGLFLFAFIGMVLGIAKVGQDTKEEGDRNVLLKEIRAELGGFSDGLQDGNLKSKLEAIETKIDRATYGGSRLNSDPQDMRRWKFTGSNLSGSNFDGASLSRANFRDAIFAGADFRGADLRDIVIDKTTILPDSLKPRSVVAKEPPLREKPRAKPPEKDPLPPADPEPEEQSKVVETDAESPKESVFVISPRIIEGKQAKYTRIARRSRIQGDVQLRAIIGTDGVARDIEVLQGLGFGLDEAAVKSVAEAKYEPARVSGTDEPVEVVWETTISFQLQ